jgi:hypothetical protein
MDKIPIKNRVTRQTESKGRQTTNSSSVFRQMMVDKSQTKKKNINSNNNSPETKKVSQNKLVSVKLEIVNDFSPIIKKDAPGLQILTDKKTNRASNRAQLTSHNAQNNLDEDSLMSHTLSTDSDDSKRRKGRTTIDLPASFESDNSKKRDRSTTDYSAIFEALGYEKQTNETPSVILQNVLLDYDKIESNDDNKNQDDNLDKKKPYKLNLFMEDDQVNNKGMKDGHFNMLHAYVRDDLFKRIKIVSDSHLEVDGKIMINCLEKCGYDAKKHDGRFINDCRMEIKKTLNSRRGYVKRKITLLMKGKMNIDIKYTVINI